MSHTVSVRLTPELAKWLESTSAQTGLSQSAIVRDELERARARKKQPFMELAGIISGPPDLSTRKGFSRK